MTVSVDKMLIEDVRSIFSDWKLKSLSARGIEFKESFEPSNDPSDDYRVVYEASFEPIDLSKARIEFWVTDTGHIAVGVETYERIGRRLGRRFIRHGFAAGHEPRTMSAAAIQMLLSAVMHGGIFIEIKSFFRHLGTVYLASHDFDAMNRVGYRCSDWISTIPNDALKPPHSLFGTVLSYEAW